MKFLPISLILGALGLGIIFLGEATYAPQPATTHEIATEKQDQEGLNAFYDTYIMPSAYDTYSSISELATEQDQGK